MNPVRRTLQIPCRGDTLPEVRNLVEGALADAAIAGERKELLCRSVEEMWGSLAEYSDFKGYRHDVSLSIEIDRSRFRAVLTESPLRAAPIRLDQVDREKTYRMGLTAARRIMDEISYTYKKGDGSELELVHAL